MILNFQQGIITYPTVGGLQGFLAKTGNYVSITTTFGRIDVTVAHGTENYLHTEPSSVPNAWGPLPANTDCWLYWDFDAQSAVRTFGYTQIAPIYSSTQPTSPVNDLHWFNTATRRMYVYSSGVFQHKIRVFAAKVNNSTFTPLGSNNTLKPFAGTQAGLTTVGSIAGRIIVDDAGNPLRRSDGRFFTTESDFFVNGSPANTIKLEANVLTGVAVEPMAKHHVVRFIDFGQIALAGYNDIQTTTIAMLMEDLTTGNVGTICMQGVITNPDWDWTVVGAPLWVSEGGVLTETDPHVANALVYPTSKPAVARVVTPTSIIFDQGLGGKGDRGEKGVAGGVALASTTSFGVVRMSTAPADADNPIAVSDNDTRLSNKVLKAGDTMTGPLVLNADPTLALHAATKQYVDTASPTANIHRYGAHPTASAIVNTAAIAAAHADSLHVIYPPGEYQVLGGFTLRSGTHIYADGATLTAAAAFDNATPFYVNENTDSYTDFEITISGLTLNGNGVGQGGASRARTVGLLRFVKVTGVYLTDCTFTDAGYMGVTLRSCKRVRVRGCMFTKLGWDVQTNHDGGSALWISSTAAGEDPEDVIIANNTFADLYWNAIQVTGIGVTITGNTFRTSYEAHIYTPYDAETFKFIAHNHTIIGNSMLDARYVDISGNAIETCAWDSVISGNVIDGCDERGIQAFSSRNLLISSNTIGNCGRLIGGTGRGAIGLITNDGSLGTPGVSPSFRDNCRNVVISLNRIYDNQTTPTTKYGVEIVGAYALKAAEHCHISGNDFSNVAWADSGTALSLPSTAWNATTCTIGDNIGATSRTWTPVVTSGTGSITSYNVSGASYQRLGNMLHFTASVTITDNGTGNSTLRLSLPPQAPALPFVCNMWNSSQSRAAMGVWSSGNHITFVRGDTGAYPVATGDTIRISGTYLTA